MRSSSTSCPHSKPLNFGIPQTSPDEKLAFVEHVLGVLIDSRYGPGHSYTTLDQHRSANFNYLSVDELETRMKCIGDDPVPFYLLRENHLRKRVVPREKESTIINGFDADSKILGRASPSSQGRASPTSQPPAYAGGSPFARGSPTFSAL